MKRLLTWVLVIALAVSIGQVLSIGDNFIELIVLGQIPGTDIQIDLLGVFLLTIAFMALLQSTINAYKGELVDSTYKQIQSKPRAALRNVTEDKELEIARAKLEQAEEIAKQLEIDVAA